MSDEAVAVYGRFVVEYFDRGAASPEQQLARFLALADNGATIEGAVLFVSTVDYLMGTVRGRRALADMAWLSIPDADDVRVDEFVPTVARIAPRLERLSLAGIDVNAPSAVRLARQGWSVRGFPLGFGPGIECTNARTPQPTSQNISP
jgi:hypothetical protein